MISLTSILTVACALTVKVHAYQCAELTQGVWTASQISIKTSVDGTDMEIPVPYLSLCTVVGMGVSVCSEEASTADIEFRDHSVVIHRNRDISGPASISATIYCAS
nr:uncharacterized protein LOC126056184 [Helicoverpa armigera]